ncbi:AMP-binding protein [Rhodocyclaceae bacterium SMB388]
MSRPPERLFDALSTHAHSVVLKQGERQLTGAQVLQEVSERAARLRRHRCERISLALDNGLEWVLWDLAILQAGRVCVPLPGFFSPNQQRHVLDSAGVDSLITDDVTPWVAAGFGSVDERLAMREPGVVAVLPAGTVKLTFTSGTTGEPKGVCLGVDALLDVARSLRDACSASGVSRHLCVLPLSVLLENIAGVYAPLLAGVRVELLSMADSGLQGSSRLDVPRFLSTLIDSDTHSVILLPQLLHALVTAIEAGLPRPDALRFIAVGGGRVAPALLRRAEALGLPVFEGYGLSECASVVCLNTPQAGRIGTVGRPLPHVDVRLADDGEILVRGGRMLGYLGEPESLGEWWATGDLGRLDDGFLEVCGRKKNQFITAFGRNVDPEWVETELVQHGVIAQAWLYGEAMVHNTAVLVPRDPSAPDSALEAVVDIVNRSLPDYARVHRWLRADRPFSSANGLATANGRLRRAALEQHYRTTLARLANTELTHGEI